jgi:hypothetical protein
MKRTKFSKPVRLFYNTVFKNNKADKMSNGSKRGQVGATGFQQCYFINNEV